MKIEMNIIKNLEKINYYNIILKKFGDNNNLKNLTSNVFKF